MSNRRSRKRRHGSGASHINKPGARHLLATPDPLASPQNVTVVGYGPMGCAELSITKLDDITALQNKWPVIWVDVDGLGNSELILAIGKLFNLPTLVLEDVFDVGRLPKIEEYEKFIFMVLKNGIMDKPRNPSISKRIVTWSIIVYSASIIAIAPYMNREHAHHNGVVAWPTMGEMVPTTQALVWPTYVWERLSGPSFEDPLQVKVEAELKKFNLIWFYLANVNRSMLSHEQQYTSNNAFLGACRNFEDYIGSLHQMIYASHALDIHLLNGIYPELGTRFQTSWLKGANLMMSACISGSNDKYLQSKAASDDWFSWYEANSKPIEAAMKNILK